MAVLVVSLARVDKDARLRFVNYGPDTARPDDGPPTTREVKDRFFVDIPAAARAIGAATATATGKEGQRRREMHPSSVIHCPGCELYVFLRPRCIAHYPNNSI